MSTTATTASTDEFEAVACGIEALSVWAASVRWEDLPQAVRRRAALVLVDDLGAMIAARIDPECERLVSQMLSTGGPAQASVFDGKGRRTDCYTAAAANAAAGTWCELDEGYRRTICHAGIYVVPALLAEGEASDATARELVRSLAVAYEIVTRIARAFPGTTRNLHPHGCLAAVGAAAAVALVRAVDPEQLRAVLDAACCMVNPMPFDQAFGGAMVRNVAAAMGASSGMRAADWVPLGITALTTAPLGVFKLGFGADVAAPALVEGLGEDWAILSNFQRIHACCQFGHSTIEATLELLRDSSPGHTVDDVRRIIVEIHPLGMKLDTVAPRTTLGAKFSMPHITAATTLLGHAGVSAFTLESVADSKIAALRERVELQTYLPTPSPPADRPARVTWQFADGSERAAHCVSARGEPGRPFTEEEILEKVASISAPVYPNLAQSAAALVRGDEQILDQHWGTVVAGLR